MKQKEKKRLSKTEVTIAKTIIPKNISIDVSQEIKPNENGLTKKFDIRILLQIFAILISITAIIISIYFNFRKEDNEKASISVQMGIQPTTEIDSLGRHRFYESWYIFTNNGKATTKSSNITWFLNNKYLDYSSRPFVSGTNHGVEITIIETSTPGLCEMKIKDLPPNVGFMVGVKHRIKEEYVDEVYNEWQKNMLDKNFTEHFLSNIAVSGENIELKNEGITELKNMENE